MRKITEEKTKSIPITYAMVKAAYKKVNSNQGGAGIDEVSLKDFQQDLVGNLYKIWNRMASGSYFPRSVREVSIPKPNGKLRKLGIPTVGDRIAQQVIKDFIEPRLEKEFIEDSYGYRPQKSAHQAVAAVQENTNHYSWVIDMDIQNFFDNIDHRLLLKALDQHVTEKWVILYIKRWLETPMEDKNGQRYERNGKGTPQGGVISPLLANLYLHYALDKWMKLYLGHLPMVRYADDVIIHCSSEEEATGVLANIKARLQDCYLSLNEAKTKIVYCPNYRRKLKYKYRKFDFLGFRFQPRACVTPKRSGRFLGFTCGISPASIKKIATRWRKSEFHRWTQKTIQEIADRLNPEIRGIVRYYGKFKKWELSKLFRIFHQRLAKWVLRTYKRFKRSYAKAYQWLKEIQRSYPNLFYHWSVGLKI